MDLRDIFLLQLLVQASQQSNKDSDTIYLDKDSYKVFQIEDLKKFSQNRLSKLKYQYNPNNNNNFYNKFEYSRYFFNTKQNTIERGMGHSIFHALLENSLMKGDSIYFKFILAKIQVVVGETGDDLMPLITLSYEIKPNQSIDEKQELMAKVYQQIRSNHQLKFHQFCTKIFNDKKDDIFVFISKIFECALIISTIDVKTMNIINKTVDERQCKQNDNEINIFIIPSEDNTASFYFLKQKAGQQNSPQKSVEQNYQQQIIKYVEGVENKILEFKCKGCGVINNVKFPKSKVKPEQFNCFKCHILNQFEQEQKQQQQQQQNSNDAKVSELKAILNQKEDEIQTQRELIVNLQSQPQQSNQNIKLEQKIKELEDMLRKSQIPGDWSKPQYFASSQICFDPKCIFGQGGFAQVYKVNIQGRCLAQKLFFDNIKEKNKKEIIEHLLNFFQELESMMAVMYMKSQYILQLRGIAMTIMQDIFYLALYTDMQVKNLAQLIAEDEQITEKFKINILKQIAQVLDIFSQQKIVHGDLKPQNVLLDQNNDVKVSDFGTTKIVEFTISQSSGKGSYTPRYSPPELFEGAKNHATDIWSFGCIAFELLTTIKPWVKENAAEPIRKLTTSETLLSYLKKNNPEKVNLLNSRTSELIEKCTKKDYKDRISAKEILTLLNKI